MRDVVYWAILSFLLMFRQLSTYIELGRILETEKMLSNPEKSFLISTKYDSKLNGPSSSPSSSSSQRYQCELTLMGSFLECTGYFYIYMYI